MNARKRQIMIRMIELARKHPSFAREIKVDASIKTKGAKNAEH